MLEVVRTYGLHLKPPSFHEIRVSLFQKRMECTKGLLKNYEVHQVKYGCSIMLYIYTNRKGRILINFLVNSLARVMFVKSVHAFEYIKTTDRLHELLDPFATKIGEKCCSINC